MICLQNEAAAAAATAATAAAATTGLRCACRKTVKLKVFIRSEIDFPIGYSIIPS